MKDLATDDDKQLVTEGGILIRVDSQETVDLLGAVLEEVQLIRLLLEELERRTR